MIISFLFTAILSPVTVVLLEACEIFNEVITSQAGMDNYLEGDISVDAGFCMFGSGDLGAKYNIDSELG